MKIKLFFAFFSILLIACSKKDNGNIIIEPGPQDTIVTPIPPPTTSLTIPLNDLGTTQFNGYAGGLYPGGSNILPEMYASDLLAASTSITPLDSFGVGDAENGYIVFISLGASTGGKNMTALIDKTNDNALVNPRLKIMNGNQPAGQAPLNFIMDPNSLYWDHVQEVVQLHKSSLRQVQVIYLETDDSSMNVRFPERPAIVKNDLQVALRSMKLKCPNLKVVYVLGRTRTFNRGTPWNTEPSPYYFGWACKWAIEDQINGITGTEYKGSNAVSPMLAWGFYQWADSLPRKTDNFYWRSTETKDGLHANEVGQDTLSNRFQNFLFNDPYASLWYHKH